jgi:HK97 family phage portal protein
VTPKRIGEEDAGKPIIGYDGRTYRAAKPGMLAYEVTDEHGEKTLFHYQRFLHIKGFGFDGIQGYSVVRRAKQTAGGNFASDAHYHKFLGKRAMPAGILTVNSPLKQTKKDRLKEDWEKKFAGPTGRQGIAVLEGDSKFHPLLMSPQDSQLLEMRRFTVEEWARWLVIPVHKLRDVTNSKTRSNIEAENRSFVEDTLRPWAKRIEEEINYKMFRGEDREEYFVEFLFDDLLRGATADRAESHFKALQGGWATVNEIRAMENLNPIEGGDNLYVPLNMATLDDDGKIVVPDSAGGDDDADADVSEREVRRATDELTKRLVAPGTPVKAQPAEPTEEAEPEPDDRTDEAVAALNASIEMFLPLMADARGRFLHKEQTRLKQGRKRLETKGEQAFLEWCSEFYDKHHVPFVAETVQPVFAAAFAHLQAVTGIACDDTTRAGFIAQYSERYAVAHGMCGKTRCMDPAFLNNLDGNDDVAMADLHRFLNVATVTLCRGVEGAKVRWAAAEGCTPECADLDGKSVSPGEHFVEEGANKIAFPPRVDACRCVLVGVLP